LLEFWRNLQRLASEKVYQENKMKKIFYLLIIALAFLACDPGWLIDRQDDQKDFVEKTVENAND
jgi:hypothetical protein